MNFVSAVRCAFLLFLAVHASTGFEWMSSDELPDGSLYRACVGDEVNFRWNFSLSADERAVHVEWYRSNDKDQVFLAGMLADHFLPAHNVTFLPTAGLRVFLTGLNAFGTYTVKVEYQDKRGYLLSSQQSAVVAMEDAPVLEDGQLVAQMLPDTVQDEATGLLQVQLACGRFISRGSSHVSVVWKTPSGETMPSTTYTDGTFRLHLAHPQAGGYSCRLEEQDTSARCIPNMSRLLRGAFVHVDEVQIRLVLLEGEARSLRANSRNVDLEFERQAKLHSKLESRDQNLTAEVNRLAEIAEALEVQTESLAANNEKLKAQVEKQAKDIDDLKAHKENLTKENELLKASTAECEKGLVYLDDGSILAFRVTAGAGGLSYKKYMLAGTNDDHPLLRSGVNCGCGTVNGSLPCESHYRSSFLDMWPSSLIDTVRLGVYEKGQEVAYVEFNGRGSTYIDWFSVDNVLSSSWTDLKTEPHNYFSIEGEKHSHIPRRFFINRNYGGCPNDLGWLVVVDEIDPCTWGQGSPLPAIIYSKLNTYANYNKSDQVGKADALVISVKLRQDVNAGLNSSTCP